MSLKEIAITVGLVGAVAAAGLDSTRRPVTIGEGPLQPIEQPAPPDATETSVYYAGCDEVRAAGKAPLYTGQPGYREGMDGDHDGIACEPHRTQKRTAYVATRSSPPRHTASALPGYASLGSIMAWRAARWWQWAIWR